MLRTTNITPGTLFVFEVMSLAPGVLPGTSLGFLGMPGCSSFLNMGQPITAVLAPAMTW